VIHHETGTASAAGDSFQKLHEEFASVVHTTTSAACEAVEAIKDTLESATAGIKDAAQSVSQAVDLHRQVQEHPWLVVGGSIALGFLAAQLLEGTEQAVSASPQMRSPPAQPSSQEAGDGEARGAPSAESTSRESAGLGKSLGGLTTWLGEQLNEAKGFATTAIMNYVHSLVAHGLDTLQDQVGRQGGRDEGRETPRPQQPSEPLQGAHQ
jgi:ElaB/YqjD/DUF883 family membrane-anchored ribosome-binding protein